MTSKVSYAPTEPGQDKMRNFEFNNSPEIDWDSIIHKNVRSLDNEPVGKVIALPGNEDAFIITTSEGSRGEYRLPRSCIEGYYGAEIPLTVLASKLEQSYEIDHVETYEGQHSIPRKADEGTIEAWKWRTAAPKAAFSRYASKVAIIEGPGCTAITIPVAEEILTVSKKPSTSEATITKEPMTESETVEDIMKRSSTSTMTLQDHHMRHPYPKRNEGVLLLLIVKTLVVAISGYAISVNLWPRYLSPKV